MTNAIIHAKTYFFFGTACQICRMFKFEIIKPYTEMWEVKASHSLFWHRNYFAPTELLLGGHPIPICFLFMPAHITATIQTQRLMCTVFFFYVEGQLIRMLKRKIFVTLQKYCVLITLQAVGIGT